MEIGVGLWLKEEKGWIKAIIRELKKKDKKHAKITVEYSNGKTKHFEADVTKIEDAQDDMIKLANNYDMVWNTVLLYFI